MATANPRPSLASRRGFTIPPMSFMKPLEIREPDQPEEKQSVKPLLTVTLPNTRRAQLFAGKVVPEETSQVNPTVKPAPVQPPLDTPEGSIPWDEAFRAMQ